jgi:hypothetical protein
MAHKSSVARSTPAPAARVGGGSGASKRRPWQTAVLVLARILMRTVGRKVPFVSVAVPAALVIWFLGWALHEHLQFKSEVAEQRRRLAARKAALRARYSGAK